MDFPNVDIVVEVHLIVVCTSQTGGSTSAIHLNHVFRLSGEAPLALRPDAICAMLNLPQNIDS